MLELWRRGWGNPEPSLPHTPPALQVSSLHPILGPQRRATCDPLQSQEATTPSPETVRHCKSEIMTLPGARWELWIFS